MKDFKTLVSDARNNLTEVDFTNKESVDKYINTINSIKEAYKKLSNTTVFKIFDNWLFDDIDVIGICNKLIAHAEEEYENNMNKQGEETVVRPSENVDKEMLRKISDLAAEYVDTIIKPHSDLTKDQQKSVYECLIEFACWIYNHD